MVCGLRWVLGSSVGWFVGEFVVVARIVCGLWWVVEFVGCNGWLSGFWVAVGARFVGGFVVVARFVGSRVPIWWWFRWLGEWWWVGFVGSGSGCLDLIGCEIMKFFSFYKFLSFSCRQLNNIK